MLQIGAWGEAQARELTPRMIPELLSSLRLDYWRLGR